MRAVTRWILKRVFLTCLFCFLALPSLAWSRGIEDQQPATNGKTEPQSGISRWLELQASSLLTRYRYGDTTRSVVTHNQQQHQELFRGRLKFDPRGRFALNASLTTGSAFTSGWDNTGWGMGQGTAMLYLKQLYLSGAPVKGLELQFGGLAVLRGESTEITHYDNDGYITGERLTLRRPKDLFFDEVTVTYAYLGDLLSPGINKRFRRLDESNYHQFLSIKRLGARATVSFDYTFQWGIETLRQAIRFGTKEFRVVDFVRFENYQRVDYLPDYGYALYAEKALHKSVSVGGGLADVDPNYGGLNGDRFSTGRRLFVNATWTLLPELSVATFFARAAGNDAPLVNRTRFDVVLTYNLFRSLQRSPEIKRALLPQ
jgi:hypothetical protein